MTLNHNHNARLQKIKEDLEADGYTVKKNSYPVFLDDGRFSLIDLVAFKPGHKPIAIELESKNSQQLRNKDALKKFRELYPNSKTCQLFSDDHISKCRNNSEE